MRLVSVLNTFYQKEGSIRKIENPTQAFQIGILSYSDS